MIDDEDIFPSERWRKDLVIPLFLYDEFEMNPTPVHQQQIFRNQKQIPNTIQPKTATFQQPSTNESPESGSNCLVKRQVLPYRSVIRYGEGRNAELRGYGPSEM